MCDTIQMPNGTEIESIRSDGACLCNSTQHDIVSWIVKDLPAPMIGERIEIDRTPFGWEVRVMRS